MSRIRVPRTTLERRGSRRAQEIRSALAADIRLAREDAGISLRELATAAGISHATLHALEHGTHDPSTEVLARVAVALGMSLSVRLYPGTGPLIRDHIQAAMLEAMLGILDERWRFRPEVAVYRPVRGVIDVVLEDEIEGMVVACEAQSELRRIEQQVRWQAAKADALGARWTASVGNGHIGPTPHARIGRLLLLRSTVRTRAVVAEHAALMKAAYPAPAARVHAALVGDEPWPGDGLLWCRVEGGRATILDRPPRGVSVGRPDGHARRT